MQDLSCGNPSALNSRWVLKSHDRIVGSIYRSTLDNNFTLTHSRLRSMENFRTSILESGEVVNFVYVLKGELSLSSSGIKGWQRMKEGSVYAFQTADAQIKRLVEKDIDTEALIIKVCRHRLEDFITETGCCMNIPAVNRMTPLFNLSPFAVMLCRRIINCRYTGETGRLMRMAGVTELLTENCLSETCSTDHEDASIMELMNHIRNSLEKEHTLIELSRMAGMSHTKLNSLFRNKTGRSVFQFIREEKVNRAEHYLKNTDMSITEIAYCTGFCSSSHFSESFRREKGLSPKLYRKSI